MSESMSDQLAFGKQYVDINALSNNSPSIAGAFP